MVGISEGLGDAAQKRLLEALWQLVMERTTISGDGATHYHGEVHFHAPVSYHGNVFYGSTHHHEAGKELKESPGEDDQE